jgi:hypothetical protein
MTANERMHETKPHFLLFVVAEKVFFLEDNEVLLEQILLIPNIHKSVVLLVVKL